jgi:hypothetical protein
MVTHFTSPRSMALARLLMSEVRRYPELINASKPKGFPRELLANWLDSPVVRTRFAIEDADDAAAMLFGMVMQDSGFRLMVDSNATTTNAPTMAKVTKNAVALMLMAALAITANKACVLMPEVSVCD